MTKEQELRQLLYAEQDSKEVEETKSDILTAIMQAPSIDKMITLGYESKNTKLMKKCELFESSLEELAKDSEQYQELLNQHLDIVEQYKQIGFKAAFGIFIKIIQQVG